MQFRLRTLMVLLAVVPPLAAACYLALAPSAVRRASDQGHWIYQAKFIGNWMYSDKKLTKVIGLLNSNGIRGWRLNAESAEDSRKKIEQFYRQAGYPQVVVRVLVGGSKGDRELIVEV